MKYRKIGLLSVGHAVTDINQGALPALLPFFINEYHLSYAAAATIVFAANIGGSLIQPFFGYWSDRWSNSWLMPAGIMLAGLGMGLCGWVDSYPVILALVIICGIGVSAFHPEAAKLANHIAKENKAMGISVFAIGGNVGFAFGPLIATFAVLAFGARGLTVFILTSLITSLIVYFQFRGYSVTKAEAKAKDPNAPRAQDQWFPFLRLSGVVIARSALFYGLNTFIPLYWMHVLGESAVLGSSALTILFTVGVFGTLLGGKLADKYGYRKIILIGWVALLPLMYLFTAVQSTAWATLLLVPVSLALFTIYSPMLVTGQGYLPNYVGFASGVTIGLAVTIGGITAPFLGWVADTSGITAALQSLIFIPVIAALLVLTLPFKDRAKAPSVEEAAPAGAK